MTSIVKRDMSVTAAKYFKEALEKTSPSPDSLYFFFARNTAWDDEQSPDTPNDTTTAEFEARSAMIGVKKVQPSNIVHVIPRINWVSGTAYDEFDVDDTMYDATTPFYNKEFYVMNTNYQVYKCIDNNSGGNSIVEPTGTSTSNISTGDGYVWKFMYDLNTNLITNFLSSDWLPVPTGSNKTAFQTAVENAATYASGQISEGHGSEAIYDLKAKYLMILQTLEEDESGAFPTNDDYRQTGLIINPKQLSDGSAVTATVSSVNDSNSNVDANTGRILYLDNREAITRSASQTETFRIILDF